MGVYIMGNNTMPKCQCPNCNNIGRFSYPVRRRGNNNAYLCEYHKRSLESYYSENDMRLGKPKANRLTYSIELETMRPNFQARLELCLAGFLPTSDCTVDAEFKSPIYEGTNAIKAFLPSIQWMLDNDMMVIDDHCGTHFHVGHHELINSLTMGYIRRFYHSLFVPMCNAMMNDRAKTASIFGRDFGTWNQPINNSSNSEEHTNFINVQHEYTLEFRSMFFRSDEQYSKGIDFCRKVTEIVCNFFCSKVVELGLANGQTLTTEQKTALKDIANKTGSKLVKLFENWG